MEGEPVEVDGLLAGLAAAGPALEDRLEQAGLLEGGSGRPRVIWVLPLQGQEPVRGGDQRGVVIPPEPGAAFVVVEAELAFELLVVELDLPAQPASRASRSGWVSAGRLEIQ